MPLGRRAQGNLAPGIGRIASGKFLVDLDPLLKGLREQMYTADTYSFEEVAVLLDKEWVDKLGLPAGIPTGVGAFDAEMGAVGGHYEFILNILYKYPVFVNEDVIKPDIINISNRVLNDLQGWEFIADEFRAGVAALPDTQIEAGRPTKNAARAYLAKVLMFKAYLQNEIYQVTSINSSELEEVVSLIEGIEGTGEYALHDDYAKNFL